MPQSPCPLLRSSYNVPPLAAIVHGSNPISFDDGLFLPSSFHDRTWLLDKLETCRDTSCSKVLDHDQEMCTGSSGMQSACPPSIIQTTCSHSSPCRRTTHQSGSSSVMSKCASQPCQSGRSQQTGFVIQSGPPVSHVAKCCPPKTCVPKNCQTLECEPSQCHTQRPKPSPCRPLASVTPEPHLLEPSSDTYEPTCCVTGGWQLPDK
ncbi:keratin-associated protein 27-1 [Saccopteryx bilineata]|uniref:keratin-associated protein 27-1 n=1 Tax=Saccopteryx bilineata TaxID=59482 RepID=UPI00338FC22C